MHLFQYPKSIFEMKLTSIKNTLFYKEVLFELNYPFGNYFIFNGFIIAEINEDVVYSWDKHGKLVAEHVYRLLEDDTAHTFYLTNRINRYSVKPTDWLKFFRFGYNIAGYGVISYTEKGFANALLEKLFIKKPMKRFKSLETAIDWVKTFDSVKTNAS